MSRKFRDEYAGLALFGPGYLSKNFRVAAMTWSR
jgi:hypothetical protein